MRMFVLLAALVQALPAAAARVYFIAPQDGARVKNPVHVVFGLEGMGVAPAGVEYPGTGHHHVLVDVETLPEPGKPIPADERHLHFGKGQTEARIELPPGRHTLRLVFADHLHRPFDPPVVSEPITIVVEPE